MTGDLQEFLSGEKLYGDDFGPEEAELWRRDELEAYAELGSKDRDAYTYKYHELNILHGYRHLPPRRFSSVLGFGAAYGHELSPIIERVERITIVDPSEAFVSSQVGGVPCRFVKPAAGGRMPFADAEFDLITCLGVLHHIPKVSAAAVELYRCLAPGGYMLLREPIRSMGDWSRQRPGLTRHERGIPLRILRDIVTRAGFAIRRQSLCIFPLVMGLANRLGRDGYNGKLTTRADAALCVLFGRNDRYHPGALRRRLSPACAYLVLAK